MAYLDFKIKVPFIFLILVYPLGLSSMEASFKMSPRVHDEQWCWLDQVSETPSQEHVRHFEVHIGFDHCPSTSLEYNLQLICLLNFS